MEHPVDLKRQVTATATLIVSLMVLPGCDRRMNVSAVPTIDGGTRSHTFSANDVERESRLAGRSSKPKKAKQAPGE